jgi:hypothetical protein
MTELSIIIGEPLDLTFMLSAEEVAAYRITRVDWELDGIHVTTIAINPAQLAYDFSVPQALLTIGTHLLRGRASSTVADGPWDDKLTLTITPIVPGLLRDIQVVPGTKRVNTDEAQALAHAFGLLYGLGPKLPPEALIHLGTTYLREYPDQILTRGRLLRIFDREFERLPK